MQSIIIIIHDQPIAIVQYYHSLWLTGEQQKLNVTLPNASI